MCGICGTYECGSESLPVDTVQAMLASIYHRGPDDEGLHVEPGLGMGVRRLSIIDVAGGAQPLYNEDRSVALVFNGEIYNYRELASELKKRGHILRTASDTEVIVHLYEDYGDDCVLHLRGMFAFALWDAKRRRLFLARDRLGIKPLYYAQAGGRLLFASEIKAILQDPAVQVRSDLNAISSYLSLKYVPAPATMFAGIRALPPGHTLSCSQTGVAIRRYWDLHFPCNPAPANEREYADELEALLWESVKLHLVSDVPFGAFLSGGIDSSTIVALMSRLLPQPVKTFSVGYEGDGAAFSELPYARLVARHCQTDHHEVLVGANDLIELADKVVWHLDQPIADDASLATYLVARLASSQVKMVLTGEGGDELFAGYARHAAIRLTPLLRLIPEPAKAMALSLSTRVPGLRRPKLALYALCQPDEISRMVNWFPLFNSSMKAALLAEDVKRQMNGPSAHEIFAQQLEHLHTTDQLSRMLYLDTKLWLPDDLLARGDKMTMAASLEARVPLLDHKLVEFAARLPSQLKIKRLARKYLLKRVSQAWVTPQILTRKKRGFPVPLSLWFRKEARAFVRDLLSPDRVRKRGLFNSAFVQALLDEHDTGAADYGSLLWGLVSLEIWHRLYIDTVPRPAARTEPSVRSRAIGPPPARTAA